MNKCIIVGVLISVYSQLGEALLPNCDTICNDEDVDSVCGSDGITYESKCVFDNAACLAAKNGTKLGMAYMGECITVSTPCDVVLTRGCPTRFYIQSYVCGTDGRTYSSECVLAAVRCKSLQDPNANMTVDLNHRGACVEITNTTRMVDCGQYAKNGTTSGAIALEPGAKPPRVELVTCNRMFEPVCSLDSHTYSNECSFCHSLALRYLITPSNLTATIAHEGMCHHVTSIIG